MSPFFESAEYKTFYGLLLTATEDDEGRVVGWDALWDAMDALLLHAEALQYNGDLGVMEEVVGLFDSPVAIRFSVLREALKAFMRRMRQAGIEEPTVLQPRRSPRKASPRTGATTSDEQISEMAGGLSLGQEAVPQTSAPVLEEPSVVPPTDDKPADSRGTTESKAEEVGSEAVKGGLEGKKDQSKQKESGGEEETTVSVSRKLQKRKVEDEEEEKDASGESEQEAVVKKNEPRKRKNKKPRISSQATVEDSDEEVEHEKKGKGKGEGQKKPAKKPSKPVEQPTKPVKARSKPVDQRPKPADQRSKPDEQKSKPATQESKPATQGKERDPNQWDKARPSKPCQQCVLGRRVCEIYTGKPLGRARIACAQCNTMRKACSFKQGPFRRRGMKVESDGEDMGSEDDDDDDDEDEDRKPKKGQGNKKGKGKQRQASPTRSERARSRNRARSASRPTVKFEEQDDEMEWIPTQPGEAGPASNLIRRPRSDARETAEIWARVREMEGTTHDLRREVRGEVTQIRQDLGRLREDQETATRYLADKISVVEHGLQSQVESVREQTREISSAMKEVVDRVGSLPMELRNIMDTWGTLRFGALRGTPTTVSGRDMNGDIEGWIEKQKQIEETLADQKEEGGHEVTKVERHSPAPTFDMGTWLNMPSSQPQPEGDQFGGSALSSVESGSGAAAPEVKVEETEMDVDHDTMMAEMEVDEPVLRNTGPVINVIGATPNASLSSIPAPEGPRNPVPAEREAEEPAPMEGQTGSGIVEDQRASAGVEGPNPIAPTSTVLAAPPPPSGVRPPSPPPPQPSPPPSGQSGTAAEELLPRSEQAGSGLTEDRRASPGVHLAIDNGGTPSQAAEDLLPPPTSAGEDPPPSPTSGPGGTGEEQQEMTSPKQVGAGTDEDRRASTEARQVDAGTDEDRRALASADHPMEEADGLHPESPPVASEIQPAPSPTPPPFPTQSSIDEDLPPSSMETIQPPTQSEMPPSSMETILPSSQATVQAEAVSGIVNPSTIAADAVDARGASHIGAHLEIPPIQPPNQMRGPTTRSRSRSASRSLPPASQEGSNPNLRPSNSKKGGKPRSKRG